MKMIQEEKSWLEWVVFIMSSVLIVALISYLIYDGIHDEGKPPDLQVRLGEAQRSAHGYVVPVTVTNKGDQTAQAVELEVVCKSPDESAALTYDFLSSGEVREGWAGFSSQPGELSVRVVGYRAE